MENKKLDSDREKIAARLKEARMMAGLSQAQAAEKLNLHRPAISEIEAGKRKVSAEELIQFSNLYKVDPSWLLLRKSDDDIQFKMAARELSKLKPEEVQKLLDVLKILPK
jgi:transcriptional regulator with XRE-family HTH domain